MMEVPKINWIIRSSSKKMMIAMLDSAKQIFLMLKNLLD